MKPLLIIIFSLFFIQNIFSAPPEKFYFDCSASVFRGSDGKNIVEFYYAVYQKFLKYSPSGSGFSADAKLDVTIYQKNVDKPMAVNTYKIPSEVSDTTGNNIKNKIVGQINYEMKFGEYKVVVTASDFNNPLMVDSSEFDLLVEDFSGGVKLSDIELATSITKSTDTKNLFYKNTLEVTPNAGGLYGKNVSELYYYCELYNLSSANMSEEATIKRRILSLNNEELVSSEKKIKQGVESRVEFGMFKIDTLKTGGYIFELSFVDTQKNLNIVKTKKFFLFTVTDDRQSSDKGQGDYLKSEYVILNEKDLDDLFDKTIYIRDDNETKTYRNLNTLEEKRKFMYAFWKKRDDSPMTPQNEFKINYFKRMNEANNRFKEDYNPGWKTDRGRIYVQYGPPDQINHYPFESDTKAYEEWKYDVLQGGVEADFIEKEQGTGVYRLVNSNIRGEFKDSNWRALLKQFH
ncbi:MAG: GWxTD domain-containing protein [Bacteroidetes bacterium]|nr:GWxTD domain-containing protein [Bacteroidota bacterium]